MSQTEKHGVQQHDVQLINLFVHITLKYCYFNISEKKELVLVVNIFVA